MTPRLLAAAALLVALLLAPHADARPGGGATFSVDRAADDPRSAAAGPHRARRPPGDLLASLALLASAVAAAIVIVRPYLRDRRGWSTRTDGAVDPGSRPPHRHLDELRAHDPDFSRVLFEDFLLHLYAQAHIARGDPALRPLVRPYLREAARRALLDLGDVPVSGVLVGGLHILACTRQGPRWRVDVRFDARHGEAPADAPARVVYSEERWVLSRRVDLRSRPPERARALGCPNCGAPVRAILGATCRHCDQPVDSGEFDWIVEQVVQEHREPHAPDLVGAVPEPRTTLDTVHDPSTRVAWKQLLRKDPTFSAGALSQRVAHIFRTMHRAWSALQWDDARPVVSDALHHARSYWIAAYRAAGLRNISERANITNLEIVRCTSDRWYDAITVRLHATGLDYTVDAAARVVGVSPTAPRTYSEYWTLIRGRAVERDDAACPECAAPLAVTATGDCSHCGAHLTTAASDWVLGRIEPDETYRG